MREDRLHRLEHLRQLALGLGHRHRLDAGGDLDAAIGFVRILDGEAEMDRRGDTRGQLVADRPRDLDHRPALDCRAEIGLVGDTLGIEAQHVQACREGVHERERRIG